MAGEFGARRRASLSCSYVWSVRGAQRCQASRRPARQLGRRGRPRLARFAGFAVYLAGARCAVARRRGGASVQWRALVGLLDTAVCRKVRWNCSSSCYTALCLDERVNNHQIASVTCPLACETDASRGAVHWTRACVGDRARVPNFKSTSEHLPADLWSAAILGRLSLPVSQ